MSSTPYSSRAPRRGQALLLAVLIMIFAALLSASFIAVVSVNLNQTARQSDKSRSVVSARAGLDYVRKQLAYSADGDRWRNELENVPPAPGDADYAFYYTPMEIAQGWARVTPHPTADLDGDGRVFDGSNAATIDPGDERIALSNARTNNRTQTGFELELVKFPDPRGTSGQISGASTFLSQVERVPFGLSSSDPDFERTGALKITVIGLSNEDPTAYTRSTAYFGGYKNAPLGQTARMVSNWDFTASVGFPNGQAMIAQANPDPMNLAATNGSAGTLNINNTRGDFSTLPRPFLVTISGARLATRDEARSAIVTNATNGVLTFAMPFPTVVIGERVELAANIGAPSGIDYDNDPSTAATPFSATDAPKVTLSDSAATPGTNEVDGLRVNGGLVVSGDILATKLRKMSEGFDLGRAPGTILASGVLALDPTAPAAPLPAHNLTFLDVDNTMVPSRTVKASDDSGIFPTGVTPDYSLFSDGWNSLAGKTGTGNAGRDVQPFQPPVIDSNEGVERYRSLTRTSKPYDDKDPMTPTPPASASLYGGGEGIYVDNLDDYEKIGSRRMNQIEFIQMLMSSSATPADFERTGPFVKPADATFPTTSLEQQHLRGWVGPDEFRARGVEIELTSDWNPATVAQEPGLFITKDSRTDNTATSPTNAFGPDDAKVWKDNFGSPRLGVYRRGFDWPTNGVVFAEGNVRIKGQALNAPRSLTVVSMNNIYIEDSLFADADTDGDPATGAARKLLLLARMNVVMNPTRAMGRPDAQSRVPSVTAAAVNQTVILAARDTTNFKVGDIIETSNALTPMGEVDCIGRITALPTAASMEVKVLFSRVGSVGVNSALRTRSESQVTIAAGPTISKIGTLQDAIQRRFTLDAVPGSSPAAISPTTRIAFSHVGADKPIIGNTVVATPIFNVKTIAPPIPGYTKSPAPETVFVSNKQVLNAGVYDQAAKDATTQGDVNKLIRGQYTGPGGSGEDLFPSTAPADDATANLFNLTAVKAAMDGTTSRTDAGPPEVGWKYEATLNTNYAAVPFFYLASVGNRFDFEFPPTPLERRREILSGAEYGTTGYDFPLSTSIGVMVNGAATGISDDVSVAPKITQFGFNPKYQDVTVGSPPEDILTSDQSFYQSDANVKNVTLDSRALTGLVVGANSLSMRQSEGLTGISDTLNPLPDYRLLGIKVEDVDLVNNAIKAGKIYNVNAFVYAQRGSWFVIPAPPLESRVRGDDKKSFFDANGNNTVDTGEFVDGMNGGNAANAYDDGDAADLNRNGKVDPGEVLAGLRYDTRYNYSINFNGSIAENQTALVNDVGTAKGAVAMWMNRWATTSLDPTIATPLRRGRMNYTFDPTVVLNGFEATDDGFRLPYSPELFDVS